MRLVKKIAKAVLPNFLLDVGILMRRHRDAHGEYPNLLSPRTFNEWIVHRNLFDRSPLLPIFVDKWAVRSYVAPRIGEEFLPKLYWVTKDPADIPFSDLPERFVVKPTHGAGWVRLVDNKADLNHEELIAKCRAWLGQSFYELTRERVYRSIVPRIMVEEFIDAGDLYVPDDYKLYVFGGRVELIEVFTGRFKKLESKLFDRSWGEVEASFLDTKTATPRHFERPPRLEEMIAVAEKLGAETDFVRVDLYQTQDKVYFGELTASPGAGLVQFDPVSFDSHLGAIWRSASARMRRAA